MVFDVQATSDELDAGHGEADDRGGVGHPVVGVRLEDRAAQRPGLDLQPVRALGDLGAERAQFAGERGEPVGLVAADVADAAQPRRRVGQRGQRREHRRSAR